MLIPMPHKDEKPTHSRNDIVFNIKIIVFEVGTKTGLHLNTGMKPVKLFVGRPSSMLLDLRSHE